MSAKKVRKHIRQQRRERRRAIREQERAAKLKAAQDAARARAELKAEQDEERHRAAGERRRRSEEKTGKGSVGGAVSSSGEERQEEEGSPRPEHESGRTTSSEEGTNAPSGGRTGAALSHREKGSLTQRGEAAEDESGEASVSQRPDSQRRLTAGVVIAGIVAAGGGSFVADHLVDASVPPGQVGAAEVPAPETGARLVCPPMPGQPDSLTSDGMLDYADRDDSASSTFAGLVVGTGRGGEFPEALRASLTEEGRDGESLLTEADDPDEGEAEEEALSVEDPALGTRPVHRSSSADLTAPTLMEVSALPGGGVLAAGALYDYHADSGPVAGLAVAGCTAPQRGQWFFGPELGGGATSLLTLANPSGRDATVEVTSYDGDGARPGSGTRSLVVPAQSVRSLNVAAIAGGSDELGVQVDASGAPVAAQLQSSRAVGPTGEGVEFLPGQTEPAEEHHLPAVPMADEEATLPELWIHAPGEGQATVELQVFGPEGQVALESPAVFTVEGGEIDTLPLDGLEAGVYDVVVRADRSVHAAVRTEEDGETPESEEPPEAPEAEDMQDSAADFSWAAPAAPLAPGSGMLVPGAAESSLHVTAPQASGTVTYRLLDAEDGFSEAQEVELAAGESVTLSPEDLGEAVGIVVDEVETDDPQAGIHAALLTEDDAGRYSVTAMDELIDPSQTVPVRLRD